MERAFCVFEAKGLSFAMVAQFFEAEAYARCQQQGGAAINRDGSRGWGGATRTGALGLY
ncbi:hypothetical protein N008_15680 [Hymenobacter sp. APR13]|nr:hypothetical protein N008_15680 [Hymenobacter sp. APR13]